MQKDVKIDPSSQVSVTKLELEIKHTNHILGVQGKILMLSSKSSLSSFLIDIDNTSIPLKR